MSELIAFSLLHGVSSGTLHLVSLRSIRRIRFKASFFLSGKFWFQLFYFWGLLPLQTFASLSLADVQLFRIFAVAHFNLDPIQGKNADLSFQIRRAAIELTGKVFIALLTVMSTQYKKPLSILHYDLKKRHQQWLLYPSLLRALLPRPSGWSRHLCPFSSWVSYLLFDLKC